MTTGDLLKPLHGVPLVIFAVAGVSVSSKALHVPVLSALPSLPQDASKTVLMMIKSLSIFVLTKLLELINELLSLTQATSHVEP